MGRQASAGGRPCPSPAEARSRRTDEAARRIAGDPDEEARAICLRLLTIRARTRVELSDALTSRQVPDEAAARVLDRLRRVGLIDDVAFAASFTTAVHSSRGLAANEIRRQLRAKGVDDDLAETAVIAIDADRERETAAKLVQRKAKSMGKLEPNVMTRRLVGMLARKGYSPGVAYQVVRDVLGELSDEVPSDDTAWLA